jgi:hypothetical protein
MPATCSHGTGGMRCRTRTPNACSPWWPTPVPDTQQPEDLIPPPQAHYLSICQVAYVHEPDISAGRDMDTTTHSDWVKGGMAKWDWLKMMHVMENAYHTNTHKSLHSALFSP